MSEERKQAGKPSRGLGRGLSALLGDEPGSGAADAASPAANTAAGTATPTPEAAGVAMGAAELEALRREAFTLPIEFLKPGRFQPRRIFEQEALEQLAQSVREKGLLQPILVRQTGRDSYEILAGERRWRAAQLARLHDVPVVLRDFSDRDALEIALVENLQRRDLTPIEEAEGYRRLRDEFNATQAELAEALGKSRSHVANMLRLLELPEKVRALLDGGALSAGHARALIGAKDVEALAQRVAAQGLSVRQTEKLVQAASGGGRGSGGTGGGKGSAGAGERDRFGLRKGWNERNMPLSTFMDKSADLKALEKRIEDALGLRVDIQLRGEERSQISLFCNDYDQLDQVVARLSRAAKS